MRNNVASEANLIRFQNDLIFQNQASALVAMFGVIALLLYSFHGIVSAGMLYLWVSVCIASYLARYLIFRAYRLADDAVKSLPVWQRRFTISVAVSGLVWGSAAVLIYPVGSVTHQTVLLLIVATLGVATTVTHSAYRGVSQIFVLCSLVPIIARLFIQADTAYSAMGALLLLLLLVLLGAGKNLHLATIRVFNLTNEKNQLVETLSQRNDELSTLNERLVMARDKAEEASRSKSLFLASMSHEIRTPMHGVLGMVQVLENTKLDALQRHYLETLERSGKTLLSLLDDVLDLSKIESGKMMLKPERFSLSSWVNDLQVLAEPFFEQRNVVFTTEVDDGLPASLIGDQTRLTQIVINLVSNAAKFTEKGEVRLLIGGGSVDRNRYQLVLEVQDTGVGIPAEKLHAIFDSFQQLSPSRIYSKGVGLGLAISQQLAEIMGTSLWVESEEGKGSRFGLNLVLPLSSDEAGNEHAPPVMASLPKLNILLVDDDPVSRLAVATLLEQHGHSVTTATNGKEGVGLVMRMPFDVVLMDVHMPIMDGIEAVRVIRGDTTHQARHIPVIGMSASVLNDERESYLQAGMTDVVEKPIMFAELTKVLRKTFDQEEYGKSG